MAPNRKPTKAEHEEAAAVERARREENLDRDLKDINRRLGGIELTIKEIQVATLEARMTQVEARVKKLEDNQTSVVRVVLGTVGAALLATVVGVQLK